MFDKLNHITLSGEEYPIKCDMLVLERIQEEYGSLAKFERDIIGWEPVLDANGNVVIQENAEPVLDENGEPVFDENGDAVLNKKMDIKRKSKLPSVKAVNDALFWMISEGLEIEATKGKESIKKHTREELIRCVDIPYMKLADLVHDEFSRCFENPKNEETT